MTMVILGDYKGYISDSCDGNGYGRYVGGFEFRPLSLDPGGDRKSEVISDGKVTGPYQRGFLLFGLGGTVGQLTGSGTIGILKV